MRLTFNNKFRLQTTQNLAINELIKKECRALGTRLLLMNSVTPFHGVVTHSCLLN